MEACPWRQDSCRTGYVGEGLGLGYQLYCKILLPLQVLSDFGQKVGDVMVAYDPAHAALPWGAVRFFLLVAVNDVQIYGTMLQSIEMISNALARCLVMEHLYLNR